MKTQALFSGLSSITLFYVKSQTLSREKQYKSQTPKNPTTQTLFLGFIVCYPVLRKILHPKTRKQIEPQTPQNPKIQSLFLALIVHTPVLR